MRECNIFWNKTWMPGIKLCTICLLRNSKLDAGVDSLTCNCWKNVQQHVIERCCCLMIELIVKLQNSFTHEITQSCNKIYTNVVTDV